MAKYLDWGGLLTLWAKIKNYVSDYVKFETETGSGADAITIGNVTKVPIQSITAGAGLNTTSNDTTTDGGTIGMGSGQARSGTLYLSKSGVTAGSYGPSADATPIAGATFDVPLVTVDKYGRVTLASTKTVTIPSEPTIGNRALKISSDSGTTTLVITMNESSADKTLLIKGDGTYLDGSVSGSEGAPIVTISHKDPVAVAGSELTATISETAGTYVIDTEYTLLTGVKAQRDAKGHVTGLTYTALKIKNTDTKVNVKERGTTKAYLLGTTTSPTSSNQAVESVAETGVYFDTTAGKLTATNFAGKINDVDVTPASTGFSIAGGTTSKTLTVDNNYTLGSACEKTVDTSIGSSSSSNLPTTDAVKNYVTSQMSNVVGALVYKGVMTAESSLLNTALSKGWYYIVNMPTTNPATTSITVGGIECESGDMIIVNTAGTYTTSAGLGEAIDVIQSNIAVITDSEINGLS